MMRLRPSQPAPARAPHGFTLPELLVVIGILLLFIVLAIPAVNALTGSRSIAGAENNLSAVLTRAREEAIGVQDFRGVLFVLSGATNRVTAYIVKPSDLPPPPPPGGVTDIVWLDLVPDRDNLNLPVGIDLHTLFSSKDVNRNLNETYLGYNTVQFANNNSNGTKLGGVILFDGSGHLVVRRYGFRTVRFDTATKAPATSGFADLYFKDPSNANNFRDASAADPLAPWVTDGGGSVTPGNFVPYSQVGFVLFDRKEFDGKGFVDADAQTSETEKEGWIDENATPVVVNRYTGTVIRGE